MAYPLHHFTEGNLHYPPIRPMRKAAIFSFLMGNLGIALVLVIIASVAVGAVSIPFARVVQVIIEHLLPGTMTVEWTPIEDQIVWAIRLPRSLLAAIVGAGLAITGATLQAVVRNPLADPYIFGVSSGASVGAVLVLILGSGAVGGLSLSLAAFIGAMVSMGMVYLLAQQGGRVSPMRLILAGVALAYLFSAITSFLILFQTRDFSGASRVLYWLSGSLGAAKWQDLGLPSLVLVVAIFILLLQARPLNALLAGEETAIGLGINTEQLRLGLFVLTSLVVGTMVALSGAIGFIGLMIPHVVRLVVGSDHRRVLPLVAMTGAVYLVLVDVVARTILAPQELPVGIVTAALGAPFFLWLLRRQRKGRS